MESTGSIQLAPSPASRPEFADSFRHLLDHKYDRIILAAHYHWQQRFGGSDPSDACVSVRVSGKFDLPLRQLAS